MPFERFGIADMVGELRSLPGEVSRNLGRELVVAGRPVLMAARRNASWSRRIPGAMSLRVSRSTRFPGVRIVVRTAAAPHARSYEFGQDRRGFRHPVFGNPDAWVQQSVRPYISPAFVANKRGFIDAADRAVMSAARRRGFTV